MATSHERAQWRRFLSRHVRDPRLRMALAGSTCIRFGHGQVIIHTRGPSDGRTEYALKQALQDWFGSVPQLRVQSTPAGFQPGQASLNIFS